MINPVAFACGWVCCAVIMSGVALHNESGVLSHAGSHVSKKQLCIAHLDNLEIRQVDEGTENGGQQGGDTSGDATN